MKLITTNPRKDLFWVTSFQETRIVEKQSNNRARICPRYITVYAGLLKEF